MTRALPRRPSSPRPRLHLLASANPLGNDLPRLGFQSSGELLAFVRAQLAERVALTYSLALLNAQERPERGGRRDDEHRVRDLQEALDDPATRAIVALSGGGYFSRILPHVSFEALRRRRAPLWALGFSEMTSLVNLVASYRSGRGVYWLCPNFLAWKLQPAALARRDYGAFWRGLFEAINNPAEFRAGPDVPGLPRIEGEWVSGTRPSSHGALMGGCLSVLTPLLCGAIGRRLRPEGRWLLIEDVNEAPHRIDRCLAALKIAGWFHRLEGVIVGDFHTREENQCDAVIELLRFHIPRERHLPIIKSASVGHVWPMAPAPLMRPLRFEQRGRRVWIGPTPTA